MALAIVRPAKASLPESTVLATLSAAFFALMYTMNSQIQERLAACESEFDEMKACIYYQKRQIEELRGLRDVPAGKSAKDGDTVQAPGAPAPGSSPEPLKKVKTNGCGSYEAQQGMHQGFQSGYGWAEIHQLLEEQQTEVSYAVQQHLVNFESAMQKKLEESESRFDEKLRHARGEGSEVAGSNAVGRDPRDPGTSKPELPAGAVERTEVQVGDTSRRGMPQDSRTGCGWNEIYQLLEEQQAEVSYTVQQHLFNFQAAMYRKLQESEAELDRKLQLARGEGPKVEGSSVGGGDEKDLGTANPKSPAGAVERRTEDYVGDKTGREIHRYFQPRYDWGEIHQLLEEQQNEIWLVVQQNQIRFQAALEDKMQVILRERLQDWQAELDRKLRGHAQRQGLRADLIDQNGGNAGDPGTGTPELSTEAVERTAGGQVSDTTRSEERQDLQARYGWGEIHQLLEEQQNEVSLIVQQNLTKFQALLEEKMQVILHGRLQEWDEELDKKLRGHAHAQGLKAEGANQGDGNGGDPGTVILRFTEAVDIGGEDHVRASIRREVHQELQPRYDWGDIHQLLEEQQNEVSLIVQQNLIKFQGALEEKIQVSLHERLQEWDAELERKLRGHVQQHGLKIEASNPHGKTSGEPAKTSSQSPSGAVERKPDGCPAREADNDTRRGSRRTHTWEDIRQALDEKERKICDKFQATLQETKKDLNDRVDEVKLMVEEVEMEIEAKAVQVTKVLGEQQGKILAILHTDQVNGTCTLLEQVERLYRESLGEAQTQPAAAVPRPAPPVQQGNRIKVQNPGQKQAIPASPTVQSPGQKLAVPARPATQGPGRKQAIPARPPIASLTLDKAPADRPSRHCCRQTQIPFPSSQAPPPLRV